MTLTSQYNGGEKPHVMVLPYNKEALGDNHGPIGIGQAIAEKTNGTLTVVNPNTIGDTSPNSHIDKILPNSPPDILLARRYLVRLADYFEHKSDIVLSLRPDINEHIIKQLTGKKTIGLVPHHLNLEKIQREKSKFEETYPDLPRPIIAVLLAGVQRHKQNSFTSRLAQISAQYPTATLFLCGSHREKEGEFLKTSKKTKAALKKISADGRIHVETYPFSYNGYNPYQGL